MRKRVLSIAAAAAALLLGTGALSAQPTFHKLVVVGDSLAAGHEANCTVERYQRRSAAALLAEALGIADFQQPLLAEAQATNPPTSYPCLGAVVSGSTISVGIISQEGAQLNPALPRPYDNLGFNGGPRVKDFVDLRVSVPGRSDVDNYAARVLRNVAGSPFEGTNAVEQAASLQPDLLLYWVGNNDLLGAATFGASIPGVLPTPPDAFQAKYTEGLDHDPRRRAHDRHIHDPGGDVDSPLHDAAAGRDRPGDAAAGHRQRPPGAAPRLPGAPARVPRGALPAPGGHPPEHDPGDAPHAAGDRDPGVPGGSGGPGLR